MSAPLTVALVGNPNTGKTTLFNALTGARERVGNWSGVTVTQAETVIELAGRPVRVVDLPGIFALASHTMDEQVTSAFLRTRQAALVINVLDASNLERSLCLTRELLDLGLPLVAALNLTDVAERRGLHLDVARLSQMLGCPVLPVVAAHAEGTDAVLALLEERLVQAPPATTPSAPEPEAAASDPERAAERRLAYARQVAQAVVQRDAPPQERRSDRVDRWLLHGRIGIPLFLAIMYVVFWLTVKGTRPLVAFLDSFAGAFLVHGLRAWLSHLGAPELLIALLADGAGAGLVAVATFVPPIFAIFLCLGVLESSGYMPRAAFVMDRGLRRIGLPGKAFIPLVVGFGCTVPALLATRTLAERRERVLTMLITPFMSCGARLPVYAVFALAFFPSFSNRVVFALYLTGILLAVLSGLLLHGTILRGQSAAYVLELPPYQVPPVRMCLDHAWFNLRSFLVRAGQIIVAVAIGLSLLNALGNLRLSRGASPAPGAGPAAAIGRAVTPLFAPMGITRDNWPATVSLLTGVLAKESVIGTLDVLYAQADAQQPPANQPPFNLRAELASGFRELVEAYGLAAHRPNQPVRSGWPGMLAAMQRAFDSRAAAFAYLLFVLIYSPCLAALAVLAREAGWRWMTFSVVYQTLLAWMTATAFYQCAAAAAHPRQSQFWLCVVATLAVLIVMTLVLRARQRPREALL